MKLIEGIIIFCTFIISTQGSVSHECAANDKIQSMTILSPVPGSILGPTMRKFHISLGVSVMDDTSADDLYFVVDFDGQRHNMDNIGAFTSLVLEASDQVSSTHILLINAYRQKTDEFLCSVSAEYVTLLPIRIAISSNTKYAIPYFTDFLGAVLPLATIEFIGLEEEISYALHNPLQEGSLIPPQIDVLIVSPLDNLDCAPGEQWVSGRRMISQLKDILHPVATWVINGEGIGLQNLSLSEYGIDLNGTYDTVNAVFTAILEAAFLPTMNAGQQADELHHEPLLIYLPVAATAFSEMWASGYEKIFPEDLLVGASARRITCLNCQRNKEIAYMYSNCMVSRERIFGEFQKSYSLKPDTTESADITILSSSYVSALGVCQGSGLPPRSDKRATRALSTYVQDAIKIYSEFRFVLAFENTHRMGYVTEKLVNAYLAGSIPIYMGAPDVDRYFNTESMILCTWLSAEQCIQKVRDCAQNGTLYDAVRNTPPMSQDQFNLFFGAFPSASSFQGHRDAVAAKYSQRFNILLDRRSHHSVPSF